MMMEEGAAASATAADKEPAADVETTAAVDREQLPETKTEPAKDDAGSEAKEPEQPATAASPAKATEIQDVKVPDLGDSDSVEIIEISVQAGDKVEKESPLIVVETDKATMEIPSPLAGTVIEVCVAAGDKVSEGDLIARVESAASESQATEIQAEEAPQPETSADTKPAESTEPQETEGSESDYATLHTKPNKAIVYASPAVRRFARELGADISNLQGTGSKGRILKEDVQKFVKAQLSKQTTTAAPGKGLAELPTIDFSKFGEIETVSLSKIQKVSSTNLHRNWVNIPHVTQNDLADITEMEAFRQSMKAEAAADGIKLTPLAFMMKATVAALKAFPRFNASLASDGETLVMKKYFHIGVAVDTPDGLVVPVVRDVDTKSVYQLAKELAELSAKAREKKLGIDAMQGACFSISSLGGIGGTSFTPIVNWPDVAILGVSKSSMQPVWNGKEFEPRLMLPLSLSYDHRVIDGALAARFVTHLSKTLGDIRRLVL